MTEPCSTLPRSPLHRPPRRRLPCRRRRASPLLPRSARVDRVGEALKGNNPRPRASREMHFRPAQFDRTRMDLVTARLHVIQRSGAAKGGRPTLGFSVEGAEPTGRTASPLPEPPRALGRRRADQRDEQYDNQWGSPSELHHRLVLPEDPASPAILFDGSSSFAAP